ncbi:MAG TPA: glycosyltransferase family 39 protein [Saprospiraceae bacterium]|nr:glycosyltransferase family 39 protein [Saprospiraceae bacterium]HMQ84138.1 glycosyltransferase family 39 protein [Saprospiraceae bacterium]
MPTHKPIVYWKPLLLLAGIKLFIHFISYNTYGLHRDEYLYLSESDHLSWGYMEVPPMIALIGKLARLLFGDTPFAVKVFPALIGAISILIIGALTAEMGGKKRAQVLAATCFLLSPAFLGSNSLFQPVSFNQFCWLLSAFWVTRLFHGGSPNNWYYLGITAGLGFLTKYSITFFFAALVIGFLLTKQRKAFLSKYPWIAAGIALLIALPNLIWQYQYDFPVVRHMKDLAATQLVHVEPADFLLTQLLFHGAVVLVWLVGLFALLFWKPLQSFRVLGLAYLAVLLLLLGFSGKDYYTLGSYSMLFAAGAVRWEDWLGWKTWFFLPAILILNLPIIPYGLPILPIEKMKAYCAYMRDHAGLEALLRWEDGIVRELPQDYADMHGWTEIPEKVARLYHSLSPEEQKSCMIYAGHYGQAGVLNFYRKKYNLPEAYSLNSSFVMWAPEYIEFDRQIQVDDYPQDSSIYFEQVILMDSIEHPLARDPGYIYYKTEPKIDLTKAWRDNWLEARKEAGYFIRGN